jgi:hypothetical protein
MSRAFTIAPAIPAEPDGFRVVLDPASAACRRTPRALAPEK